MSDFASLAESLSRNIKIYQDYLQSAGLPPPSYAVPPTDNAAANGAPSFGHALPKNVAIALENAKEESHELHLLLLNPVELVLQAFPNFGRTLALNFITKYRVAEKLGPNERKSFKTLADECNLDEHDMRRMLRLAMTDHLFDEPERNIVAHTKASLTLVQVPNLDAWVENFTINSAYMMELPEVIGKWPGSEIETESASAYYRKQKGLPATLWEQLKQDPKLAVKFGKAMEFHSSRPTVAISGIVQAYDFSKLPSNAIFVDVGGSHGKAAIAVAEVYPEMRCIVQDISEPTIAAARSSLPANLKGRVEYQIYDFWHEQPVKGADVYFFRWIFHDWSDGYAVKLLKTLIPSLKAGSRVVINDACLPSYGEASKYRERTLRTVDLMMKSLANAKERDAEEWKALFEATDTRFKFQPIIRPPGMQIAIIEAVWDP